MSICELGGFAEYPEDIDGNEICFNAFNFCLAEDYYAAMKTEDFEALGHIDRFTFKKIQYWLNYNNELTKEQLEEIKKNSIGLIKTENNRTFAEAVIANRKIDLAIEFIFNGNFDVRLYALTVAYDYDKEAPMILYFPETIKTVQDYIKFVQEIFSKVDLFYLECSNYEEEKQILENIKLLLTEGCFVQLLKNYKIELNELFSGQNYKWTEELKRLSIQKQLKLVPDEKGNLTIG